jgi:hypothetical protein
MRVSVNIRRPLHFGLVLLALVAACGIDPTRESAGELNSLQVQSETKEDNAQEYGEAMNLASIQTCTQPVATYLGYNPTWREFSANVSLSSAVLILGSNRYPMTLNWGK